MPDALALYRLTAGAVRLTGAAVLCEYDVPIVAALATNDGTVARTLANTSVAATGTVDVAGTLAVTLDDVVVDVGEGVVGLAPIDGALTRTLAELARSAAGTVGVRGAGGGVFVAVTLTADGSVFIPGVLAKTFAAATLDASGAVTTPAAPTGLPIAAPDRPALAVEWLFDVGAFHLGTRDLVLSGVSYMRGLVRGPTIEKHLDQTFYGFQEISRVTLDLANPTGALDTVWSTEHRGTAVTLRRYDRLRGVLITEFTGVVEQVELDPGVIRVHCVNLDLSVLDTLIPRDVIRPEVYGSTLCPDAGKPEQKVFGVCDKVPLPYVRDDVAAGAFWYLVSMGTGYTITAVYRDRIGDRQYQALDASEYAVFTLPGRTLIFTGVRQLKAGGGFHRLYADVTGPTAERNFARAVRVVMTELWALNQTVNAASFDAAEAALPPQLLCDGLVDDQRPARDWLQHLLMVRGMRPGYSTLGWTLTVDTAPTQAAMKIRDAPGVGERTMLKPGRRLRPTLDEQVKFYRLHYRKDLPTGTYLVRAADRTVSTLGMPKEDEHPMIRDRATADMVACYRAKRLAANADAISGITVTEEGRALSEGQVVNVASPLLLVNDLEYQIAGLRKASGEHALELVGWNPGIYAYDPLTLPSLPVENATVVPPPVSAFTLSSSGVDIATDPGRNGQVSAFFIVAVTMPNSPTVDSVRLDLRRTGTTAYGHAQPVHGAPGATVLVRVGALVPGGRYDLRAVALSALNESTPQVLNNLLAPGDTTAPPVPTFTLDASALTVLTARVTSALADDHKTFEYQMRTAASAQDAAGAGALSKGGTFAGTLTLTNTEIGYGVTRHVRLRAVDQTGNPTTADGAGALWTATQAFTCSPAGTIDLGDGSVGGTELLDGSVITPKLGAGAATTEKISPNAVTQTARVLVNSAYFNNTASYTDVPDTAVTVTTTGGAIILNFHGPFQVTGAAGTRFYSGCLALLRGSTVITETMFGFGAPPAGTLNDSAFVTPVSISYLDSLPAGTYTYKVQARMLAPSAGAWLSEAAGGSGLFFRSLQIGEFKR